MQSFNASIRDTLNKAHAFEASCKAHSSVLDDEFYSFSSAEVADAPPGTVLKVERDTNTSLYTLPPNLAMSRFMYQSETSNGRLVPVTGFVLWPYIAREYENTGGLPAVYWSHGTSGVSAECAPSNVKNLWHHFQSVYQIALDGFVVVATDYAGLGVGKDAHGKHIPHEYITGPAQGNDVYYSVIAARKAFPELARSFVVVGHSEGGTGAWGFAEKQAVKPTEGYLGTAAMAPVTSILDLPSTEPIMPLLVLMLTPTLESNYPAFSRHEILTPSGAQALDAYTELDGCNSVLFSLPVGPDSVKSGWQSNPTVQKHAQIARVGADGKPVAGPFFVLSGGADPIVHPPAVEDSIRNLAMRCPELSIEYYMLPGVTHAPSMYGGITLWMDWVKARFEGKTPVTGFANRSESLKPVKSASVRQTEANWFVQNLTQVWQMT